MVKELNAIPVVPWRGLEEQVNTSWLLRGGGWYVKVMSSIRTLSPQLPYCNAIVLLFDSSVLCGGEWLLVTQNSHVSMINLAYLK